MPGTKTRAVEAQHAIAEELAAAIDARLAAAPPGLHLDDLLVDAWDKLGREMPALEVAAHRLAASYDTIARAQGYTQDVANVVRGQAGALLQIADQELIEFTQSDELAAAEAEVQRIEQASRDAMTELQAAVESANVEEVLRLRPQVEIVLPQKRERARVALLELQVARSQQAIEVSARRKRTADAALSSAERSRNKAEAALRKANADLETAQIAVRIADGAESGVAADTKRLVAARDEAASSAARSSQQRLRRLAGLTSEVGV